MSGKDATRHGAIDVEIGNPWGLGDCRQALSASIIAVVSSRSGRRDGRAEKTTMGRGKNFHRGERRTFEQDAPNPDPAWTIPPRPSAPAMSVVPSSPGASHSGTVRRFDTARGFGFIRPDDGSPDVFVHISAVKRAGLAHAPCLPLVRGVLVRGIGV